MTAAIGWARRVGAGAAAPSTKEFFFRSCGVQKAGTHVSGSEQGMRGKRGHQGERVVDGTYTAGGPLVLEPTPDELDFWLPRIMGAGTTPAFTLAETIPEFVLDVDKGANIFRYEGCKVNQATFRSAANGLLELSMDIQGKTETGGITFPAIEASLSLTQPYIHHNLVATVNAVVYKLDNLEVVINNALILDRFLNSQTRTELPEGDRIITVAADFPFNDGDAADNFYNLAVAGIAGTFQWTNGAVSLLFTFPKLQAPTIGPEITGRNQEVMRRVTFQARRSAGSDEMTANNDSTP